MVERIALTGRHVRLDPMRPGDAGPLLAAALEERSSYGYTFVPDTIEGMRSYMSVGFDDQEVGSSLLFTARRIEVDRVVGTSRFLDLDYWEPGAPTWPPGRSSGMPGSLPSAAEIGCTWLAASAQRTAINTEMKLLMLTHAFEVWGVERLTLKTDARNLRSRRAVERLGAVFEGIRRAHTLAVDGTIRDSAYYSVVRAEWPGVRERLHARLGG